MKKIILFITLFVSVAVFGQKINNNGLKVVSNIDIEKIDINGLIYQTKNYSFSYNKNSSLMMVDCVVKEYMGKSQKCVSVKHINIKRTKNNIIRNDYDDKTCIYRYDFNDNIIIRSGETYRPDLYGWVTDIRNIYDYENGLLTEITRHWFGKYKNRLEYEKSSERYHYIIDYIDGNPYSKNNNYEREVYYDDLFDDTNVNLNALVWDKMGQIIINDNFIELCTEWMPFKSNNLLKYSGIGDNQNGDYNIMTYMYDNNENIEYVFVKSNKNDLINRRIHIKYLY
jgi:hypothetical protein